MAEELLDTSIFVDLFRRSAAANRYIGTRLRSGRLKVHAAVAAELIAGVRNKVELGQLDELLGLSRMLVPSESDWTLALRLCRAHNLSDGTDWVDCLVAATAMRLKVPIATLNDKHFRPIRGLEVVRPY